ncbi:VOC family protein [Streptomyces sp. NPDC102381]|uniref:VOC family protein n=1 Tax=Streptomyces sp. NPDC102381 TaxID=3366164 RepID=UPI0038269CCD
MTTQETDRSSEAATEGEGTVCFWHIRTPDAAAARVFYEELFGWEFRTINDITFAVLNRGRMIGCMIGDQPAAEAPGSVLYIYVADLPRTLRRADELGAKVLSGPQAINGGKAFADLSDPTGTVIGLFTDNWRE